MSISVLYRHVIPVLLGASMLVGCASTPAPVKTVYTTVNVPVMVSCVPKTLGPAPSHLMTREEIAAIPDGPARYVAMAADWAQRVARMNDTEPVIASCARSGAVP